MVTNPDEYGLEVAKAGAEAAAKESVNKIASAIGDFFPFFGMKHKAIECYIDAINKSNLSPENKMLAIANSKPIYKHLQNQFNVVSFAEKIAKDGTDFSKNSKVDEEWLERFMDSAKFVSDEKVQFLWGSVLAKEFESPGSTPPSVIRILSEITPTYAKIFQVLCSLSFFVVLVDKDGEYYNMGEHIILPTEYDYLKEKGINYAALKELEMLGMILVGDSGGGHVFELDNEKYPKVMIGYGEDERKILKYSNLKFPIGIATLTKAGRAIFNFTEKETIEGHFNHVCEYMKKNGVQFEEK